MKVLKFIESIRLENGKYSNLPLHQQRINRTFQHHFPGTPAYDLSHILPQIDINGLFKVRVVYDKDVTDIEYAEYRKRTIQTLEVVEAPSHLDYAFKYENRELLNTLKQNSGSDDIIIVKNGYVTDSSYANLAFFDGAQWLTPDTYLLNGVRRQQLLSKDLIREAPIREEEISSFEKVSLINAMLDLGVLVVPLK